VAAVDGEGNGEDGYPGEEEVKEEEREREGPMCLSQSASVIYGFVRPSQPPSKPPPPPATPPE
jgi:hypothetical protein